jgi:hypothetical protein
MPCLDRSCPSSSCCLVGVQSELSRDGTIRVSGFCGEDAAVVKLSVVPQVDTLLCHL